jgi:putative membrane protein
MMEIAITSLAAVLYAAAAIRVKRRRGRFQAARAASFGVGVAVLLIATLAPLESSFAAHMSQHLLLGDLAPLFVVLGLNGPLLRPALALRPVRALRVLAHPLVALPLWAVDLCTWHVAPLFDAALRHEWLHALQHVSFFTGGALLWTALLEPLPGPRWFRTPQRLAYLGAMWLVSLSLSQVFLWSTHAYYTYGSVSDQRTGGGIMLLEGSAVMLGMLAWTLWRALRSAPAEGADVVALPL